MTSELEFLHDLSSPLTATILSLEAHVATLAEEEGPVSIKLQQALDMLAKVSALIQARKEQIRAR